MSELLDLNPDDLLSTTRAVRKRLDLSRAVEPELVRECISMAAQAPTGGNAQGWHFVVVTDPDKRRQLGEWYRAAYEMFYGDRVAALADPPSADESPAAATERRVVTSSAYLAEHMGEVPVHVIPVIQGRMDGTPGSMQAAFWGSLLPAVWSFCLAARARGLGTCWTTLHLMNEKDAAELLGIPVDYSQGALIPVAHTLGTDFRPGPRRDLTPIIHTNTW